MTRLLLACVVLLVFPYSSFADFSGLVISILDGDTIEVLHEQHPERIRYLRLGIGGLARPDESPRGIGVKSRHVGAARCSSRAAFQTSRAASAFKPTNNTPT